MRRLLLASILFGSSIAFACMPSVREIAMEGSNFSFSSISLSGYGPTFNINQNEYVSLNCDPTESGDKWYWEESANKDHPDGPASKTLAEINPWEQIKGLDKGNAKTVVNLTHENGTSKGVVKIEGGNDKSRIEFDCKYDESEGLQTINMTFYNKFGDNIGTAKAEASPGSRGGLEAPAESKVNFSNKENVSFEVPGCGGVMSGDEDSTVSPD